MNYFFNIEFLDHPVLTQMRLKTKFRDRDDTTEQVWGPKRVISKFRNRNDIAEQVWGPKRSICKFRDRDDTTEQVLGPVMDFIISSPKLKMDFTTDSIRSYFFNEKKKKLAKRITRAQLSCNWHQMQKLALFLNYRCVLLILHLRQEPHPTSSNCQGAYHLLLQAGMHRARQ